MCRLVLLNKFGKFSVIISSKCFCFATFFPLLWYYHYVCLVNLMMSHEALYIFLHLFFLFFCSSHFLIPIILSSKFCESFFCQSHLLLSPSGEFPFCYYTFQYRISICFSLFVNSLYWYPLSDLTLSHHLYFFDHNHGFLYFSEHIYNGYFEVIFC